MIQLHKKSKILVFLKYIIIITILTIISGAVVGYLRGSFNPYKAAWHQYRGSSAWNACRYDEALRNYKAAVELDPSNANYHYGLGLLYAVSREWGKALHELAVLEKSDISYGLAEDLTNAILLGRYSGTTPTSCGKDNALAFTIPTDKPISKEKADIFFRYGEKASEYLAKGQYDKALEAYEESLAFEETSIAHYSIGRLYLSVWGDLRNAEPHFNAAKKLVRNTNNQKSISFLYYTVANTYSSDAFGGYVQKGIETIEEFLEEYPNDALALYGLASIYLWIEDRENLAHTVERLKDIDTVIYALMKQRYTSGLDKPEAKSK